MPPRRKGSPADLRTGREPRGARGIQCPSSYCGSLCVDFYESDVVEDGETADGPVATAAARLGAAAIEHAVRTLIAAPGDRPDREGLAETPARVARAWGEWFAGYAVEPAALLARTFGESEGYRVSF